MSTTTMSRTASINNGPPLRCELTIDHHVEVVHSLGPKTDTSWSYVDAAGHFHAYDQTPKADPYPTLLRRVEVMPCDNPVDHGADCDGANIIHWHCSICDEDIKPGLIAGPHTERVPGRYEWSARIDVPAEDAEALFGQDRVSFRAASGDMQVFGVAGVIANTISSTGATVELIGIGPLGSTDARQSVRS